MPSVAEHYERLTVSYRARRYKIARETTLVSVDTTWLLNYWAHFQEQRDVEDGVVARINAQFLSLAEMMENAVWLRDRLMAQIREIDSIADKCKLSKESEYGRLPSSVRDSPLSLYAAQIDANESPADFARRRRFDPSRIPTVNFSLSHAVNITRQFVQQLERHHSAFTELQAAIATIKKDIRDGIDNDEQLYLRMPENRPAPVLDDGRLSPYSKRLRV